MNVSSAYFNYKGEIKLEV